MQTKIKLCGLFREEDIQNANIANPDYVGFVFAKSRRQITRDKAREFRKILNPGITEVGVFVDEDPREVVMLLQEGIIDIAQLHGEETGEDITFIKSNSGKPVIKAIKVTKDTELSQYNDSPADFLLLDSGNGSGEVFDWSNIKGLTKPFFLAGGINLENVSNAIEIVQPYGIDVSSGIETNQLKDGAKMQGIVERVRYE